MTFDCPHCGNSIKARDDTIGQKGKCPHCRKTVLVRPGQVAELITDPDEGENLHEEASGPDEGTGSETVADGADSEPEEDFKFGCPHCRKHIQAPISSVGRRVACPQCQREIVIPDPTEAAATLMAPKKSDVTETLHAQAVPDSDHGTAATPPPLTGASASAGSRKASDLKPWRLSVTASAVTSLPWRWPFLLGLALPVVVFALGHIPWLYGIYDRVVLSLVHRVVLPLVWMILVGTGLLSLYRQDTAGICRASFLFVVGLLLSTLLVFDCWYFVPFAMAAVVAMTLWRIRWLWWSRCHGVAGLTVLLVILVLGGMVLNLGGLLPEFDNRFGFGMAKLANIVSMVCLFGTMATMLGWWCLRYVTRADVFNRSLLADLIARDPRCSAYFDAVKKVTRCIHPAANVPAGRTTRLEPCASVGGISVDVRERLTHGVSAHESAEQPSPLRKPAGAPPVASVQHTRRIIGKLRQFWNGLLSRFGLLSGQRVVPAAAQDDIFPSLPSVPPVVNDAWNLADRVLQSPSLVRVVRLCRMPSRTLALPSDVIRDMITEAAQREYGRYWDAVRHYWYGPGDRPETAWHGINRHFARLVLLYEASIEANHYFFVAPSALPSVSERGTRIEQLKAQIKKALDGPKDDTSAQQVQNVPQPESTAEPAASEQVREAQREVWQRVYTKYLDLWLENVDRLMVGLGIDMFEKVEELQTPVNFAQLTCNLLACRAEIRRLGDTSMQSIHSLAADLALWLLIQQTCPERIPSGQDDALLHEANVLFARCFATPRESFANTERRGRSGRNHESSAALQASDAAEFAAASCAYALWQGACGNWDAAFRPVFLFGQFVFGACATAPHDGRAKSLVARSSTHALLRTAIHIKAVQALRALRSEDVEGETPLESGSIQIGNDLDFGKHVSLESAVAMFLHPSTVCRRCSAVATVGDCDDGDFLEWHKSKGDAMVICIGNHALHLLRDSAPHANSASAE